MQNCQLPAMSLTMEILFSLLLLSCFVPVFTQGLEKPVNTFQVEIYEDGKYDVKVDGVSWLPSGPTFFNNAGKKFCTDEGTLKLVRHESVQGLDFFGLYNKTIFSYKAGDLLLNTSIKVYVKPQLPVAFFTQSYGSKAAKTQGKDRDDIISSFPSFRFPTRLSPNLAYLAYGDNMAGWDALSLDRWTKDANFTTGIQGGPLVLFDKSSNAIVISPSSNFMAASNKKFEDKHVSWGIMGLVDEVPENYSVEFIVTFSNKGVNEAMHDWGYYLTHIYNKTTKAKDQDLTLSHLGYWTDAGAYYYYNTEKGKNYEDTLIDEAAYLKAQGIPMKYLQIDSWFYPKGHIKGTRTWQADHSIFPHGFKALYEKTKLPIGCHNRYWDNDTTYASYNGGKYNFIPDVESGCAVPDDQQFWIDLFNSTRKWGKFILYEQDWLNKETDWNRVLLSDPTLGRRWLMQMGHAAQQFGITIQYCTSYSRHILQSLEVPAVTQARVSSDYKPGSGNGQYKIGITAMLASALNLAPSKDTFWSTNEQPGNPYHGYEKAPYLQTLIATLSGGPFGPGDGLGYANKNLLLRCCDSDGKILRASRPLTIMDKSLKQAAFERRATTGRGEVLYSTVSEISGTIFGTIIASGIVGYYKLVPSDLFEDYEQSPYIYNEFTGDVRVWSDRSPLTMSKAQCGKDLCVYRTSPVFKTKAGINLTLFGESGVKFSPVSPQRFSNLRFNVTGELSVDVNVNPQEAVTVWFMLVKEKPPTFVSVTCTNPSRSGPLSARAFVTTAGTQGCIAG